MGKKKRVNVTKPSANYQRFVGEGNRREYSMSGDWLSSKEEECKVYKGVVLLVQYQKNNENSQA
jgi:hypothetical protein